MNDLTRKLILLIDEFDSFGKLDRNMPLFAIAIGTLRKDREIAEDIVVLNENSRSGMGALGLSRILTEDYFNLRYLNNNPDLIEENLDLFNSHPTVDHYGSMKSMLNWGYPFSKEEALIFPSIEAGFEKNKEKFLRRGKSHEPYKQDNYYRTWTRLGLEDLISKSGFEDEDLKTLHFLNENYNTGSTIIHHNAFNIWYLATQGRGTELAEEGYRDISARVTFIVLNRILNLVINIFSKETKDEETALHFTLKLEKILDEFNAQ
ncbi:hypothetical protein A2707_03930 [Candidatus Saccharibacteria bacterium RIFCSPHIGHO2_01_FULL_45_15]|nr:MAG: hypothetical protein A2707_03930 [Candidatus Saccharibacteria bacterium RIFCSPHIGHO2_01_FULL_45_15]OGL31578.1 MAG: hypothetical protein A3E76_02490 [Candidatus Saccharibacteria bacterium RIFCSPHIGHO2_12_FULL_44_22]